MANNEEIYEQSYYSRGLCTLNSQGGGGKETMVEDMKILNWMLQLSQIWTFYMECRSTNVEENFNYVENKDKGKWIIPWHTKCKKWAIILST